MKTESDTLQRFLFEEASIRGEIAHIESTFETIIHQRSYPPMVKDLLGQGIISCLLLASSIQFEGNLSLQFHGDHRLPLLLVQCDHDLNVRAFATFAENLETRDYAEAFLQGKMVLNITQYNQTQTYQSIVPIQSTSMSENLMEYFAQSEQIPTFVWLGVGENKAAGILLQLMPGENTLQKEQFWEYATHIAQTLTEQELLELDNKTLLHRLYHETELRLFDSRSTRFQCSCSREKMQKGVAILGEEDLNDLLKERGQVEAHCDFCNKNYIFDAIDVTLMFK